MEKRHAAKIKSDIVEHYFILFLRVHLKSRDQQTLKNILFISGTSLIDGSRNVGENWLLVGQNRVDSTTDTLIAEFCVMVEGTHET